MPALLDAGDAVCSGRHCLRMAQCCLFVGGGSKWFAFCQARFELSLCHSNRDAGQAIGDRNLELRESLGGRDKFKCGDHT